MAKIRDYAITAYSTTTASMVMEMPEHESGDLLVACLGKDTASTFNTPSGWVAIQTGVSLGAGGGLYARRATSSSETVTFTLSAETCVGVLIAIQDVYGTTVGDAIPTSNQAATDSTLPFSGGSLTTAYANSLLISMWYQDTTVGTSHLPPWVNLFGGDVANGGCCVAYSFAPTASTVVSAPEMWSGGIDDGRGIMIEVRDGSSGASIPPYIPLSTTPTVQISPLCGVTGTVDNGTYRAAASIAITSIAGKTVSGVAVATLGDSGYNPFRGSMRNAGVSSTTNLNHVELSLTSSQDVTTGDLIFGTYLNQAPRDYVDTGKAVQGGVYFLAGSTTANWRAWVVGGQFSKTERPDARNNFLIQPSFSTTEYASAGTPNFASLRELAFGSAGYYGAPSILWSNLFEVRVVSVAGGSSSAPFNFDDIVFTVNAGSGDIPLIQQSSSGGMIWCPLKFGGTEATHVLCNLNSFQMPRQADGLRYVDFHVDNNKIGYEFDGQDRGSGDVDTLHFTNCVFTSPSSYYWRFASTHDTGADIDFTGTTVINANVTLRSTVTLDGMAFISCSPFTLNSAVLTNCEFTDTTVSAASPAAAGGISDTTFIKTTGTSHAIEIGGTAADVTLTGLEFIGYAASNGSTGNEAIYVNIASGSMTISIAGGGSTPSIRTAGATVTVQNAVTVKVTTKDAITFAVIENARVLIEAETGGDLPSGAGVTITRSGSTATVTHTAHGLKNGMQVIIRGANQSEYNGIVTISNVSTNTYDYTVSGTPTTPATGTINSTAVILTGLTNASGILQTTSFNFTTNQPIKGKARRSTIGTKYQTAALTGTITSTGLDITVLLISDE